METVLTNSNLLHFKNDHYKTESNLNILNLHLVKWKPNRVKWDSWGKTFCNTCIVNSFILTGQTGRTIVNSGGLVDQRQAGMLRQSTAAV